MIILEIIEYGLAIIVGILFSYQLLLSFSALRGEKIHGFAAERNRKFIIVLPAHNKAKVISKTLYSLYNLVYPKNLYDVVVIADNCTDNTANISRNLGAIVLETFNEKGRENTLHWAFDQISAWGKDYDAVIIFNADSLVSGNYLEVMNYYLDKGSQVIQSSDLILPQPGLWRSEASRIGLLLYNFVKPMGRKVLGFDIGLRGNGMCLSMDILQHIPWKTWSLNEEIEYSLMLLLSGVSINFAPEAKVWAQMSEKSEGGASKLKTRQLKRYPIIRKYAPKFLYAFLSQRGFRYFDTFIDLITPPLVNTLFFVLTICAFNLIFWGLGWIPLHILWIWLGIAFIGVLHLFVGLYAAGEDREIYKSALYVPLYLFCILNFM